MTQPQENTSAAEFLPPPLIPTDIENDPRETAAAAEAPAAADARDIGAETIQADKPEDTVKPQTDAQSADGLPQGPAAHSEEAAEQSGSAVPHEEAGPETASEQDENRSQNETEAAAEDERFPTADEIRQAIYDVVDPEINISIIDLGLVYDIIPNPENRTVHIDMTLTSPGCPLGPEITAAVYLKVTRIPGVRDCQVDLVWSPMWDPMVHPTEETRMALGIW